MGSRPRGQRQPPAKAAEVTLRAPLCAAGVTPRLERVPAAPAPGPASAPRASRAPGRASPAPCPTWPWLFGGRGGRWQQRVRRGGRPAPGREAAKGLPAAAAEGAARGKGSQILLRAGAPARSLPPARSARLLRRFPSPPGSCPPPLLPFFLLPASPGPGAGRGGRALGPWPAGRDARWGLAAGQASARGPRPGPAPHPAAPGEERAWAAGEEAGPLQWAGAAPPRPAPSPARPRLPGPQRAGGRGAGRGRAHHLPDPRPPRRVPRWGAGIARGVLRTPAPGPDLSQDREGTSAPEPLLPGVCESSSAPFS